MNSLLHAGESLSILEMRPTLGPFQSFKLSPGIPMPEISLKPPEASEQSQFSPTVFDYPMLIVPGFPRVDPLRLDPASPLLPLCLLQASG